MNALPDTMMASLSSFTPLHAPMHFTHAPNDRVLDRYTIQRGIGVGGFGEVYFAVSDAGKEVALKRIQRNLDVELRGVSHCLNLKHPNLVSLHDICRDGEDQAWVVMEYVSGLNLRQVLDKAWIDGGNRPLKPTFAAETIDFNGLSTLPSGLSEEDAVRWFRETAAGVGHLHAAGLVHRDLKPGNLFDDAGTIKVGDYGLSKFISVSHRSGHTESVGTFHYMAPEIGRGQYGREIDIYSLGVILFELLTGEVPFDGESPQEIIVKHLTDAPDLNRVPPRFREAIGQALQKDPLRRPSSVEELVALISSPQQSPSPNRKPLNPSIASAPQSPVFQPTFPNTNSIPPATSIVLASPSSEEPLARAVRNSVSDLARWWRSLERSPGSKVVIALATMVILLINTHWLLPLLSMVGIFYVPYYIVRHMVLQVSEPATYAEANQLAASVPPPRPMSRSEIRRTLRDGLASRTKLMRAAEWSTSGMTSMIIATVLLLITSVVGLRNSAVTATTLAPYAWMACVVWLGSVGLLSLGKWWENSEAEGISRRLGSGIVGALVGLAAFGLAHFLLVPMDIGLARDIDATSLPESFYQSSGIPKAAAMMAHFAVLFSLLRMWKPVDPLRRVRLSLWAVVVAVVGEWITHQLVPIPQPSGMLIAGGMMVVAQVSAPWVKQRV